jgi:prolyl 4-hydroxylase
VLSVVIPFLNESTQLQRTLHNLRDTAGDAIKIIVVNDNSDDFFNYEALARHYHCTYIRNETRKGVARSRDIGVSVADTEFVLLLDAHMKFFAPLWQETLEYYLRQNTQAIYCTKSVVMDESWAVSENSSVGTGVKFKANQHELADFLTIEWLFEQNQAEPTTGLTEIPCVMGAAYAFSRDFYHKLGGLAGLHTWGFDEQLLSLKAQMAGGHCYVINELRTGHVYRTQFPYHLPAYATPYNKMVIAFLTDAFSVADIISFARQQPHSLESAALFEKNMSLLTQLKQQLQAGVFVHSIWDILPALKLCTEPTPKISQNSQAQIMMSLHQPEIYEYANVLSAPECQQLIEMARTRMSASTVANADTGGYDLHPDRTSDTAYFKKHENDFIAQIEQRISELTGIPEDKGEPLQVLRYLPGAEYKPHFDYFDPGYAGNEDILAMGGQRFATLIIYLNNVEAGGETILPRCDLKIVPVQGNALCFSYSDAQGNLDQKTLHGGAPVIKGEKWIITKWFRLQTYTGPNH